MTTNYWTKIIEKTIAKSPKLKLENEIAQLEKMHVNLLKRSKSITK